MLGADHRGAIATARAEAIGSLRQGARRPDEMLAVPDRQDQEAVSVA